MKNMTLSFTIVFLTLFSSVIFAEAGTSTSSTVTNTSTTPTNGNGKTTESTTYSTTTSSTSNSSDDDIVSAIYSKYAKESALTGTTLTVSSQNGVVTISGTVTAQAQADEASIAAKSVAGVKEVKSSVNVITNPGANKSVPTSNY